MKSGVLEVLGPNHQVGISAPEDVLSKLFVIHHPWITPQVLENVKADRWIQI